MRKAWNMRHVRMESALRLRNVRIRQVWDKQLANGRTVFHAMAGWRNEMKLPPLWHMTPLWHMRHDGGCLAGILIEAGRYAENWRMVLWGNAHCKGWMSFAFLPFLPFGILK